MTSLAEQSILILGASGMLGSTLFRYFRDHNCFTVVGASRAKIAHPSMYQTQTARLISDFEVGDHERLASMIAIIRPSIIINAVGIIKQRKSSLDPLVALPINAIFPHRLSRLCQVANARLIHISTDCVFLGAKGMYREQDKPDAADLYGMSKYLGELHDEHCITIRTSLIGHELGSNNSLVDWFLSQTGTVNGYRRAIFSGLPTIEIARIVHQLLIPNPGLNGLYHVASDPIDKFSLLELIKKVYRKGIHVEPSDDLVINRSLNSERFSQNTGYRVPKWDDLVSSMHAYG